MKYGLTRNLNIYSLATKKGDSIIATAGDYIQSQLWCDKHLKGMSEGVADLYQTFVWAWFAMNRNDLIKPFGLSEELSVESLDVMSNTVTVFFEEIKEDQLPLATQQSKSQK